MRDYYSTGDHNVICDICGFKYKSSYTRKTWDNLIVCLDDWESKPQAIIPIIPRRIEGQAVRDARPQSTITVDLITIDKMYYPVQIHMLSPDKYDGTHYRLE